MPVSQLILAVAIVASWGFNAAISKVVVSEMPTLAFLSLRFFATALIFMPFSHLKRNEISRLLKIAVLLNLGHFSFIFYSLHYLSASSCVVLQQIQVPMAMLLGVLLLKEKISHKQMLGIGVAFCGILCIYGLPDLNMLGFAFNILGSLFWALSQLELKKSKAIDIYTFITYTTLFSSPVLMGMSLLIEDNIFEAFAGAEKLPLLLSFFYQVVILGAAMMLWQKLVAANGVNKVVPVMMLQVLFGIIGGMLLFDEQLNLNIIAGAALTMSGVGAAMLSGKSHKEKERAAAEAEAQAAEDQKKGSVSGAFFIKPLKPSIYQDLRKGVVRNFRIGKRD